MRKLLLGPAIAGLSALVPAMAADWENDGDRTVSTGQYQAGRLAMAVSCPQACDLGVRFLSTDEKAVYVSLSGDDFGSAYLQTLDGQGAVTGEELLKESRGSSPFPSEEPVFIELGLQEFGVTGFVDGARLWWPSVDVAGKAPATGAVEILHEGAELSGVTFEDRIVRHFAPPTTGAGFTAQRVNDLFYSETVSVGDVDNDGTPDIVAGPRYYLGPDFTVSGEIWPQETTSPNSYSIGMLSAVDDFNGDGWDDVLNLESGRESGAHAGVLYLNPQGERRHWDRHVVIPTTQGEAAAYDDIDGDGVKDLLIIREGTVGIARPKTDPREAWDYMPVSQPVEGWLNPHGLGIGDVDGDGRKDVLHGSGWWRQPAAPDGEWAFTPVSFGYGAQIHVADLNGDGLSDVIGSWDAHGWGLNWFEQTADGEFVKHVIMGDPAVTPSTEELKTFSQPHAVEFTDLDGDGLKDIVTGKRWWAHRDTYMDPDGQGAPVVYAFLQGRENGEVTFTPHFIGDHVGVGNQIAIADLDGDGSPEIVTSARKGTIVYRNGMGE